MYISQREDLASAAARVYGERHSNSSNNQNNLFLLDPRSADAIGGRRIYSSVCILLVQSDNRMIEYSDALVRFPVGLYPRQARLWLPISCVNRVATILYNSYFRG